jgi:hypothetical protein
MHLATCQKASYRTVPVSKRPVAAAGARRARRPRTRVTDFLGRSHNEPAAAKMPAAAAI